MAVNKQVIGGIMTAIVVVILFAVVPMIGETADSAVTLGTASNWNSSVNTDIPTGYTLWETVGGVATLVIILSLIAIAIKAVVKLGN